VRIGGYWVGRPIGAGGMSTIFAARQESDFGVGRLVALKTLALPGTRSRTQLKILIREALVATQIDHPNVVRTYELVRADDKLCLAMEYVHGAPLHRILHAATPLPPFAYSAKFLAETAAGLHAAHELRDRRGRPLGIVHQDVSPHNVMIGYDGRTKLLDFGVARLGIIDGSWTAAPRGKPAYFAPEQVTYGRVDRRADVFAMGLVLFELLTGERHFNEKDLAENLKAVAEGAVKRADHVNPDVPPPLANVVAIAMARNPSDRFPTAQAFREALLGATSEAGLTLPTDEEVARWLVQRLPPEVAPSELETEIVASVSGMVATRSSAHMAAHSHSGVRTGRGAPAEAQRTRARDEELLRRVSSARATAPPPLTWRALLVPLGLGLVAALVAAFAAR
jgi:serine/threonine-protein kinase